MSPQPPTYCPICGQELNEREEGGRVRPACDNCGYVHFHNPVPGVGLVIEMDGGIVLIQRGHPPAKGVWTLPSGFVEADESAEEAAIREAEEETGLKIEIVELAGVNSFPEGPPVSGIMIFFRARPVGGTLQAGDDAADVRVFQPHEVPRMPFRTHREMMAEWLAAQDNTPQSQQSPDATEIQFAIRRAETRDLDEMIGLLALIPANRQLVESDWCELVLRFRESPTIELFVAEARQKPPLIIGCVALSVIRALTEGRGLINDMAVLPTYQRQGVGAELLEAVMRRADQLNLRSLMVNTQRANDQARAFYAALGFSHGEIMQLKIR
jgi:ADP-ribose pyrophosphatase YjhB (NUDIX family)/N-acetylglutamate synthase-like GNAT family acetyltransferase